MIERQGDNKDYYHEVHGKAPDLGAIELGDTWKFPRPGPRWAQGGEIVNRPAMPATLPLKWVGQEQARGECSPAS